MSKKQPLTLEVISQKMTNAIGTTNSLVVHTFLFVGIFVLILFGVSIDHILLTLTTVVSLEAIYLAIFIQMTVNRTTKSLAGVEEDIDDIQENVDDLQEDVGDIQEDVDSLESNFKGISDDYIEDETEEDKIVLTLQNIEKSLRTLEQDILALKKSTNSNK